MNGSISGAESSLLNQLVNIANSSPHAELIAKISNAGDVRGFVLESGNLFKSEIESNSKKSKNDLLSLASLGNPVTVNPRAILSWSGVKDEEGGIPF
ncbi:MAG: hypothetical protein ACKVJU_12665 [Verrucomicrobiales bacterium]